MPRHYNNWDSLVPMSNLPQNLRAVHDGHSQVAYDYVDGRIVSQVGEGLATRGEEGGLVSESLQHEP
jgi:hypothetical protein